MVILVTGASGFLGSALIPRLLEKGHTIYGLSRHPPEGKENLGPLIGDITEPDLGLEDVPGGIGSIYHLAAIHRLGENKADEIWQTNVGGTINVIEFCKKYEIPHLFFISTSFTQGRNSYERSKAYCEWMVANSGIPRVTIFKPSIIMGTPQHFYPGHFSQFVALVIKVHQRAEMLRRWLEGKARLPVIEPVFRLSANPGGKLNMVPIDVVASAMADIDKPGTYWLTHPEPPTISQLVEWLGQFIMVRVQIEAQFSNPSPPELVFHKMAAAFEPYLWGDNFPSDIKECPPITKEYIEQIITKTLFA